MSGRSGKGKKRQPPKKRQAPQRRLQSRLQPPRPEKRDRRGDREKAIGRSRRKRQEEVAGIGLAVLGVGSVLTMPLAVALVTIAVAVAVVGWLAARKRTRVAIIALGASIAGAGIASWLIRENENRAEDLGKARLAIVAAINEVRRDRGLSALDYSPELSLRIQRSADYERAQQTGATGSLGFRDLRLPELGATGWAVVYGHAPSWQRVIDVSILKKEPPQIHSGIPSEILLSISQGLKLNSQTDPDGVLALPQVGSIGVAISDRSPPAGSPQDWDVTVALLLTTPIRG